MGMRSTVATPQCGQVSVDSRMGIGPAISIPARGNGDEHEKEQPKQRARNRGDHDQHGGEPNARRRPQREAAADDRGCNAKDEEP